jgi:hypothetical protein
VNWLDGSSTSELTTCEKEDWMVMQSTIVPVSPVVT